MLLHLDMTYEMAYGIILVTIDSVDHHSVDTTTDTSNAFIIRKYVYDTYYTNECVCRFITSI